MKLKASSTKTILILMLFVFNFMWLAEIRPLLSDSLNAMVRYIFSLAIIVLYLTLTSHYIKNIVSYSVSFFLFVSILVLNLIHSNPTLFAVAFFIYPFLILLFTKNASLDFNLNKVLVLFQLLVLFYSLALYFYIFVSPSVEKLILNENEVSVFSLLITMVYFIYIELYKKSAKLLVIHILITFFIGFILDARAVIISIFFLLIVFVMKKLPRRVQMIQVLFLGGLVVFFPLVIIYHTDVISSGYSSFMELIGVAQNVISSDESRLAMYQLVYETISTNWLGKGLGNSDYLLQIDIAGLHSGALDLLYWGGIFFYLIFICSFIYLILYSYNKNTTIFYTPMVLLYWLLFLNYYEGLLFGNMGLTVLFVYLVMVYFSKVTYSELTHSKFS